MNRQRKSQKHFRMLAQSQLAKLEIYKATNLVINQSASRNLCSVYKHQTKENTSQLIVRRERVHFLLKQAQAAQSRSTKTGHALVLSVFALLARSSHFLLHSTQVKCIYIPEFHISFTHSQSVVRSASTHS